MKRRKNRHNNLTVDQKRSLMQIKIRDTIEKHGCFCMGVFGSEDRPQWTYSIGIPTTVPGTAEIMVYGLDPENATHIINDVLEDMKKGRTFEANRQYDGVVLRDLPVYFGRVEERYYDDHFGQAQIYHDSDTGFTMLQLVWPDRSGKFPWQPGFEEKFRDAQPLLFEPPVEALTSP